MIDTIWCFMIITSLVFSLATGTVSDVSAAVFTGAKTAVTLTLTFVGTMAFWLGITEIAEQSGLTKKLQKLLFPLINFLFPEYRNCPEVKEKISLNFTANLLGLGNAATPLGLAAMDAMEQANGKKVLTKGMILFVVINTASLQLLPTQMAALRSAYGSAAPFSILPQVWVTSLSVMIVCVMLCKMMEKKEHELSR